MPNVARQNMTLNLVPSGNPPVLHVSQYDSGWVVYFTLYNGTSLFSIPSDATVRIQGTKSDKHGISKLCTKSQQYDSQCFVYISEQMTAAPGPAVYELCVVGSDGKQIGTTNFIMAVEPAALRDDAEISDSEIALAQQVLHDLQSVETYATRLDTMENRMDAYETLPEGSTTGDAELIDIRAGADGVTYTNAGTAVRTQVTNLQTQITENAKDIANLNRSAVETPTHMQLEAVTLAAGTLIPVTGIHGRVLNANGIPTYTGQIQHHVSEPIYCRWPDGNGVITAHLRGSAYYGNAFYAFYDSEWAVVGLQTATTEDVTSEFAGAVTVPANARYMRISWNSSVNEPRLYFDAGSTWYFPAGTAAVDGRLDAVEGGLTTAQGDISTLQSDMESTSQTADNAYVRSFDTDQPIVRPGVEGVQFGSTAVRSVPLAMRSGVYMDSNGILHEGAAAINCVSGPIYCVYPNSGGVTTVRICASAASGHAFYAFYDENFNLLQTYTAESSTTEVYRITREVPVNAFYLRISWRTDDTMLPSVAFTSAAPYVYVPSRDILPNPELRGKKWLAIGDGYTRKSEYTTLGYYDLLKDSTTTVTIQTAVVAAFRKNAGIHQIVQNLDPNEEYDLITVMAGMADAEALADGTLTLGTPPTATTVDTSDTTIYGIIFRVFRLLLNNFDTSAIVVMTEPYAFADTYVNNANEQAHRQIQQAVRDVAAVFGLPVVDIGKYGGITSADYVDGDPGTFNNLGMRKVARYLGQILDRTEMRSGVDV